MNNVVNRNYNCNQGRVNGIYNESFMERLVTFLCTVIAFFEDSAVNTVCRFVSAVFVAVGIFFYVSAFMSGALSVGAILIYGMLLIAASAFVFKTDIKRS